MRTSLKQGEILRFAEMVYQVGDENNVPNRPTKIFGLCVSRFKNDPLFQVLLRNKGVGDFNCLRKIKDRGVQLRVPAAER